MAGGVGAKEEVVEGQSAALPNADEPAKSTGSAVVQIRQEKARHRRRMEKPRQD
jgi:hypothetical protein